MANTPSGHALPTKPPPDLEHKWYWWGGDWHAEPIPGGGVNPTPILGSPGPMQGGPSPTGPTNPHVQNPFSGVSNMANGAFDPKITQIDPTPYALRPLQELLAQLFMQRLQNSGNVNRPQMPTLGQTIFQQLYGQNQPRTDAVPMNGPGVTTGPNDQLPNINLPRFGDVVSGSRLIRSNQPTYRGR